jgi:hypothetical protein
MIQTESGGKATANSRSGFKAWDAGMDGADGITMMFGIHGGEEISGGFVAGLFLLAAPVDEQAVAETAKHADDAHGMGLAHPAEIVEVGDIQALMQAGFDAPGRAIELEPLPGV